MLHPQRGVLNLEVKGGEIEYKRKDRIPAIIDWRDPVVKYGLDHRVKYARLVRRKASSPRAQGADFQGYRYYVQLALEGTPYRTRKMAGIASPGKTVRVTWTRDEDSPTRSASSPPTARAYMGDSSTRSSVLATTSISRRFLTKAGRNSSAKA